MLRAPGPGDTRGPAWQRGPDESAARRDLAALGLVPTVLRGREDGEGSATDCPRGIPERPPTSTDERLGPCPPLRAESP